MRTMDVNPPFTDQEKRFVLAEAIKTSSVPVEKLLPVFYDGSIQPDWHQMLLPHGRNLQSCINTFEAIRPSPAPAQPPPPPFHTQTYQLPVPVPPKPTKRKPPPESLETSGSSNPPKKRISDIAPHTSILPKPSIGSPGQGSPNTAQGKKRGRPSKAAVAQRDAEAIARGEVIAPPRTSSLRPDTPGGGERMNTPIYANIAPMVSPRPAPSPIAPALYETPSFTTSEMTSPGKKKRPSQKKTPKQVEPSFSVPPPEPRASERTTYPSIVSSLTDTVPTSYAGESTTQSTPQPMHTLPPLSSVSAPAPPPPPPPPRSQP